VKWSFISTGENTGVYNMDLDLQLATHVCKDEAVLRLYQWKPYCISLGANQNESVINKHKCDDDGITIVKRPTGGRAILHAEELTYSVVMHCSHENSPQKIYKDINDALLMGLGFYDERLTMAELEYQQPDYGAIYRSGKSVACFAETAKNELKFAHKKLIGSAQRKMGGVVLQHGSILCGSFHKRLPRYLLVDEEEKVSMIRELLDKTTEIGSILQSAVDYTKLEDSIVLGFEKFYGEKVCREMSVIENSLLIHG